THWLGHERQAGDDRGGRFHQQRLEQAAHAVGVALHQRRAWIARAQNPAKSRVELDEHESRRMDARLDQGGGDRPRPRAALHHRPIAVRVDKAGHRAREHLAGRRYSADAQRALDPRADEAHFVIEADAALALELPDVVFDFFFDFPAEIVAPTLKQPY